MSYILAVALVLLMQGCASERLFPICFYNEEPSKTDADRVLRRLEVALENILDKKEGTVVSTADGRWLIAKTTSHGNAQAARVWPRIGCIGMATTSDGVKREMECVNYIRSFIVSENYFKFGNAIDSGGIDIWNESPDNISVVRCRPIRS